MRRPLDRFTERLDELEARQTLYPRRRSGDILAVVSREGDGHLITDEDLARWLADEEELLG